uniref:Dynein gamma chain, flagellar outer arm n=1 Tax=Chlamydomonas reinhardtii TaxID=3055 RepID=DYHG_CHLRE|nr:RecName: Full=Dynein gamma chain, flagellar outer arm [Chlamydomonas reinhardtii]7KZM_C Chain C, Dynein gamma chain, flagellar outer arm [Chlamydomonas reinhardtii]7KZN_C Chain C, Dynein gamma chain, flagellar outer arm [Chlamydomonas reinhardtii]7KZO_C Chain C, Dynein gamma chain, flagellar outer arm [Chlamydomonas reinhardtii]8GLV_AD Chain AD, Dynein gamma chain, flagellar outer arm [Chlamydomonas reinhardtii]8GLV_AX Chain AX, Dynein gamma chain, flagellar outer arm [Chlamydomonas reinhar
MALDNRHRLIVGKLAEAFGLPENVIEKTLTQDKQAVNSFFTPAGPPSLVFVYQVKEDKLKDGSVGPVDNKPTLHRIGPHERIHNSVYFTRLNPKGINEKTLEADMGSGELSVLWALENFKAIVSDLYLPIMQEQQQWGKMSTEYLEDFLSSTAKFGSMLTEAVATVSGGVEPMPDPRYIDQYGDLRPAGITQAAGDDDTLQEMEECLTEWCREAELLLNQTNKIKDGEERGPDTELEYWRTRMSNFNSITEHLKTKECKLVLGICSHAKTKAYLRWRGLDVQITDAANESKDNVKYLATLEKSMEPMYQGRVTDITESLPALMTNVRMMYTIARFYSTAEHMTRLFTKITNQLVRRCKEQIMENGKIWDQDKVTLIGNMKVSVELANVYRQQYRLAKETLAAQPKSKQFDFDEQAIFLKFDLSSKALHKLIDMFTTIHQFSSLEQHTHIEGLDTMLKSLNNIIDDVKRKPYDLLDYSRNAFDTDFLEFNVQINDLELQLQGFVNASFEHITSTEHALSLLAQFQAIMQRETLQQDLENKYMVIFQNYAKDLDAVQKLYEKNKYEPPVPRNAPPVAGNIMWARQLLRRIEAPMQLAQNKNLLAAKESKKNIKTYNKVAKALIEFETLWHQAWIKSIEQCKAGLAAPLLVQHPDTGKILVNFDKEIMQLVREAKYMQRFNIRCSSPSQMVLLQEEKFKFYHNQLTHLVREYEHVLGRGATIKPLLRPHLDDMERKIAPGFAVLTWTSLNIDGYLHRFKQGLARLEELVRKVVDLTENRVDSNLGAISSTLLVELPTDRSFTYEGFVEQNRFQKKQAELLAIRNEEVRRAIEDLYTLVRNYPRENTEDVLDEKEVSLLVRHYSKNMYNAIMQCTLNSLQAMKRRLGSKTTTGIFFMERPFFDVDVELKVPSVCMNPTLEEIQAAINQCAKKVLTISKQLPAWGMDNVATYHEMMRGDRRWVKAVLRLTGSVEGIKTQVGEYIRTFDKYDFLWKEDLQAAYDHFMRSNPTLEAFEAELKKYMAIETEVTMINGVNNIGALSLETHPLKNSLKAEAVSWKTQFAQNLHKQCSDDLKLDNYIRDTNSKFHRKIEDLEDVRNVMAVLKEVREKESEIDNLIGPIEEMYGLLMRYEVRVPKEETTMVSDLRYGWKKLKKVATEVSDNLTRLQVGFKRELIKEVKTFVVDAQMFRKDWEANAMVPGLDPQEAVDRLRKFQQMFEVRKRKWENYSSGEELFGLPVTQYPELEQTEKEIQMLDRLYSLYVAVITTIKGYGDYFWVDVVEKIDEMGEQVQQYQNQSKKLPKLRDWPAYNACRKTIDDFLEMLPLFQALTHKSMRERHWKEVMRVTGHELNLAEDHFKLQHLLDCNVLRYREDIEDLTGAAVKEEIIEVKLNQLKADWATANLALAEYKNRGPVILKPSDTSELMEKLEESQMTLGSMATNRYSAPFRDEVQAWSIKLSTVSEIIEQWLMVQSMWQYMEAVFSGGDIVKQLPQEAKRFLNIDKNFMKIVSNALETQNVINTCFGNELMKNMLPHLHEQLEMCQKSLSAYLEQKRAEFPRFTCVGPHLLEICRWAHDPPSVVPHFQSGLFDSLSNVTFDRIDKTRMTEMFSQQNEKVEFERPVDAKGNIEVWLQRLVDGMEDTVKQIIKRAVRNVAEMPLEDFVFGHPAQVSLLGIQFQWTAETQMALSSAKVDKTIMNKNMKKVDALLRDMVNITVRLDLTKNQRTNLETCITVHMHQKESTEDLVKKKIKDPTDFEWLKQVRFYWRDDKDTVIISICDVDFEYSFEYLGVKERLVITPLTDICYITLSQALGMFLGGAPAGPAGTGKTETTKDLGNTLGKYVVVFNCSDQFDYTYMGKIYKGLAQSGLWGCFDEFNRINLDVLSVCAQQVYCICRTRERKKSFQFTDGTTVSLDPRVGFFITMNPGYAGAQELPENLKALFRGVTMMVPNRQIIMKVKLAAAGYQENDILSKKFFVLYGLCEQQLSKQAHYDFGLRNILSVLRTAGASKRQSPDKSEVFLMMRTVRDMNMSKFVAEDVPLFLSLIDDLFPGLKADATRPDVNKDAEKVVLERGLQVHPTWMNKCIQLYETYLVRHGIMLVGPSGSGKSAICECLAAALTELGTKHVIWRMNPKAITAPQMFGRRDDTTGDWTDGIFAVLWRRAAKNKNQNTWIVLDGPVDAIWIENLNTVLDDNKVLTLANGDRILMSAAMKAMFEPENLNNASPATVSRAGIIYVSDVELGWEPPVKSWLQKRDPTEACWARLFSKYIDRMLEFVRISLKPVMYNEQVSIVGTVMTLLNGYLKSMKEAGTAMNDAKYERVFLYCMTWSLGGLLEMKERPLFDQELRTFAHNMPPKEEDSDTIFEFLVNTTDAEWLHWRHCVPVWTYPKNEEKPQYAQLVIPTLDSVRYGALLNLSYNVDKATLLVGGPGTAKTNTINQFISKFNAETTANKTITFSSLTTPGIFQMSIEGAVEKRQGRTFGPPGGKQMCIFVDDISMPYINEWGHQVTNEIVRQLLEQGGMYSLEKPIGDMKFITDVRYVAAMNTPGGGKNDIPNRLKRQFAIFNVPLPSVAAINGIFGKLVEGRFSRDVFCEEVVYVASKLVPLTITLWNRIQTKMLPTPAKFHYLFNMRELSKVFQGVILATRDRFNLAAGDSAVFGGNVASPEGYLLGLWIHECRRVFSDKLISYEDKNWVDKAVFDLCRDNFSSDLVKQVEEPIYFVDFLREPAVMMRPVEIVTPHPSFYYSVPGGLPEVRARVEGLQRKFNEESKVMKLELVLFTDCVTHLMRITRLLAWPGLGLLVGVGGSGKQSLSRLSAYIAGPTFYITKTYNVSNLFEHIKGLYKIAGFKGQPVYFIFTDAEVKDEGFLEYINQILMTGEVAGLLTKEDQDMIVNDIRPVMKHQAPGILDTYDNLYNFFLNRVRDNLHVVLCFSPVGAKFARRAQQFPGLINGCTIDWFCPGPKKRLTSVSGKFIDKFTMACPKEVKNQLELLMGHAHVFVTAACKEYFEKYRRYVYVTPKSYLSFLQGYKELYAKKWSFTKELAYQIEVACQKMFEPKADVNKMKAELAVKNQTAVSAKEAEALLKQISESTAIAEKEKQKVAVIVDAVTKKASEIATVKDDAERDLAAAKPALDAALEALNSIKDGDIKNLKALKKPPQIITRIFDCVLVLRMLPVTKAEYTDEKGRMVQVGNYPEAQKMMNQMSFLQDLKDFAKEQINDETVELLEPYFMSEDFTFENAQKGSGNVAGLCNWAESMAKYHNVAKVVEPKIAKLREAEAELKLATKEKNAAEERMAKVQAKLDEMQAQFDAAMAHKQALEDDAAATQRKMDSANALIGALAGEEARWTAQSKEFDVQIQRLTGDCALASAFVSYLGPFNKEFRELLLNRDFYGDCMKLNVPVTPHLQITKFLVDDSEVGEWNLQGLPTDELSIQNGIMVTRASRYPVLVDPQGQGREWIKNREEANQLKTTQLNDKLFRNHLEECLAFGRPLLIENIEEELDPLLDPVLERRLVKKGKTWVVPLADKEVDFTETFRLFCTTRLPNPHFTPELSAKVTVVDFTVTMAGLEDQLLGKLISKEKKELEDQRQQLLEEVQSYKKRIKQLEDDLLCRLSNSQGNLLDEHQELIDVLAVTKQTAQDVSEKLANASETNKRINEACEEYRPVAHRATLLYFLIAEFSVVNCMYQTSLAQFNQLYELAIDRSEKANMPSKRIHNIIEYMTYEIYLYVQRGLFERHKIIFALMLTNKVLTSAGKVKATDLDVFLKGGAALDINSVRKKPKDWIPDLVWLNIIALSAMDAFRDIPDSVFRNDGLWRQWYDQEAPEMAKVPDYEDRLNKFERMCVVKTFREDRTLIAAADYIAEALGQRFVESVPLNMEKRPGRRAMAKCPLICLLSPGPDPTKLIEDLAKKKKIKTLGVSMGQGQEVIARKHMAAASLEGHWVLLQNTHLGLGYLTEVETFLVKEENVHEDFRLWITAEPHPQFPIGLLQMGIKITNEAPVGIKAGLRASYQWVNQDMLDMVSRQEWRQLLFVMCFLHSVVQEPQFGPIGWNVPYEFNQSDLSACVQFLQNHLSEMDAKKAPQPTWETVRYMISAIQYGSRITDDFDKLLMDTFAEKYFLQPVLQPSYELFKDTRSSDGFSYRVPDSTDIETFGSYIETLPGTESPEIFGLHPNADITFRTLQVQESIVTILDTMPKGAGSGSGLSREDVVDKICEDLLSKAPPLFDKEETKEKLKKLPGGPTLPLTVHLRQEIDRLNIVTRLTTTTLKNLALAIAGTIAAERGLIDALDALFNARIPQQWLSKSWEASTLGNWFTGLLQRYDQLNKWLNLGRPKAYWMTGFFNPQGFLTAMKQEVNRKHRDKWALDDVVMSSEVTHRPKDFESLKEGAPEGVYVYGLYLDLRLDGRENRLMDSDPKKLFNPLPVLHVDGVLAKDKKRSGLYEAPKPYRVKARKGLNFITTFSVRTEDDKSKWILPGVGILCSID